jgi:hypothetical protein
MPRLEIRRHRPPRSLDRSILIYLGGKKEPEPKWPLWVFAAHKQYSGSARRLDLAFVELTLYPNFLGDSYRGLEIYPRLPISRRWQFFAHLRLSPSQSWLFVGIERDQRHRWHRSKLFRLLG